MKKHFNRPSPASSGGGDDDQKLEIVPAGSDAEDVAGGTLVPVTGGRLLTRAEFRDVTKSHVLAWLKSLEARQLQPATIRRKLSALASLFVSVV